ncbi:hypothetical protein IP97_01874 [Flavobacterium cheniae]|uniref:PH (Pleckstrin Homology) domain-containing protein n=1 Tax=Flavobacterium cheniae TaxID=295428 RepID=A0A562KEU7_9FLAO|nr:hypothetical protein C8D80_0944 [Flavobacterium cheniae]TWH93926.1 hypothetical protein IP97_01874 [Flavobacterium cheniae]
MDNVEKIYPAVNVKSFVSFFWFILVLAISVIASIFGYVLIRDGYWKISFFTLPFILLTPYIIFFSLKSKIILTKDSIIRKVPFSRKEIKYYEIKTLKIYDTIGNGYGSVSYLESKKPNSKSLFTLKTIFVSDIENSHPNKFTKGKQFTFHATNDIYSFIEEKISNKQVD